jgi:hypothetical protein
MGTKTADVVAVIVLALAFGVIGFLAGANMIQQQYQNTAVKNGAGEFYMDANQFKQFRWVTNR